MALEVMDGLISRTCTQLGKLKNESKSTENLWKVTKANVSFPNVLQTSLSISHPDLLVAKPSCTSLRVSLVRIGLPAVHEDVLHSARLPADMLG